MRKRRVILLGSTGSIGRSSIRVAGDIPDRMEIVGMAANRSATELARQANSVRPATLCLADASRLEDLEKVLEYKPRILVGQEGLLELATQEDADMVIVAIVGTSGLAPSLAAIRAGKDLAVASKEILVMAGEAVMSSAKAAGVRILPVDSEHNAIFQCLEGEAPASVRRLILTASGGPFRQWPSDRIASATVEEALKHPTWNMGQKITIDSATLFNKGLEMIEARWLFDVEMDRVDVVVHPQSIVHSMVEFVDGSVIAQLSHSDMCFPIQYAVTWPDRTSNGLKPLDFAALSRLDFEHPRYENFPALNLAREAGTKGGTLPAVLNAANEIAVEAFVSRKLGFAGIWETVATVMRDHLTVEHPTLNEILTADEWARGHAASLIV